MRGGSAPLAEYGPLPKIGKVAIGGFSAGSDPVLRLIDEKTPPTDNRYPDHLFSADPAVLRSSWQETWDLDMSWLKGLGIARLIAWLERAANRRLRLYQTAKTTETTKDSQFTWKPPPRNQLSGTKLLGGRRIDERKSSSEPTTWATEVHEDTATAGRWSAMIWSTEDLSTSQFDPTPPFFEGAEAHSFAAKITLGHAALVSSLNKWPSNPRLPNPGTR